MIPKTIKDIFDQIQIDADNQIIFNRSMYEKRANEIVESLLKQQRENCMVALNNTRIDFHTIPQMLSAVLNAKEPGYE